MCCVASKDHCSSEYTVAPFGAIDKKIACPGIKMMFHAPRERWGNTQYA
jgi:hypothetical protein